MCIRLKQITCSEDSSRLKKKKGLSPVTFLFVLAFLIFLPLSLLYGAEKGSEKSDSRKGSVELDYELEEDEQKRKKSDEKIYKESIDVEGDNEQLLHSQKKESQLRLPPRNDSVDWQQPDEELSRLMATRARQTEKTADVKIDYGSHNSFEMGIHVTKKDKYGIYLFNYDRVMADSKGTLQTPLHNSEYSFDKLGLLGEFSLANWYRLNSQIHYFSSREGMQGNPDFDAQSKRYGRLQIENFFTTAKQRTLLSADALIGESALLEKSNSTLGKQEGALRKISGEAQWQYMFNLANSFVAQAKFQYDEQDLQYQNNSELKLNRLASIKLWDVFPLLRNENQDGVSALINVTLGLNTFWAYQMKPNIGPLLVVNGIFQSYMTKITFARDAVVPAYEEDFFEKSYRLLQHYSQATDVWYAQWYHRFNVSKFFNFGFIFSYEDNRHFYDYYQNVLGLYDAQLHYYCQGGANIFLKWVIAESWFLETQSTYKHAIERQNLLSPFQQTLRLSYQYLNTLQASFETQYFSKRTEYSFSGADAIETSLPEIILLNLHAEYFFNPTISLKLRFENLLNVAYKTNENFQENGLRILFGVHIIL